jgi:tetratricopeptide (TPR) repeat protein
MVMRCLSSGKFKLVVAGPLLAGLLAALAGCTTRATVVPDALIASPAPPPPSVEPSVAPLPDGRFGFVIHEVPNRPEDWQGDFDAAVACLARQDYGRAVEFLQQVVAREPGVTAPYLNLALAYRQLGKPELAEEALKKALELFPAHPVAGNAYGLLLRSRGRFTEARTVYEEVLARFPDYAPAQRNLAILCDLYLNDLECAQGHYELYRVSHPQNEQVSLWLADVRQRLGQAPEGPVAGRTARP